MLFIFITSNVCSQETPDELYSRLKALRKEQNKPEEAAQQALIYLQTYPEKNMARQKIHYEYSAALFQQKKFDDAKTAFSTLVNDYAGTSLDKDSADFMVDDAQYFYAMIVQTQGEKDLDKAIEAYKIVVEKFPKSNWRPNAIVTIGDLCREKGKRDDSLNYYYQVVADYPKSELAPNALFWANRVLIDNVDNALKKAFDPSQKDIDRVNKQKDIKFNIMTVMHDYAGSQKIPDMLQDYIVFLVWRQTKENLDEMRTICDYLIENYPGTPYAEYAKEELADQLRKGDNVDQTIAGEIIDDGIKNCLGKGDMDKATNWIYYKSKLLMAQGKYREARQVLSESLEDMPDTPIKYEIKRKIASSYRAEKKYAEARQVLTDLIEEFGDNRMSKGSCIFEIAMTYIDEQKFEKAIEQLKVLSEDYSDFNEGDIATKLIPSLRHSLENQK